MLAPQNTNTTKSPPNIKGHLDPRALHVASEHDLTLFRGPQRSAGPHSPQQDNEEDDFDYRLSESEEESNCSIDSSTSDNSYQISRMGRHIRSLDLDIVGKESEPRITNVKLIDARGEIRSKTHELDLLKAASDDASDTARSVQLALKLQFEEI